jgi:hypothetical protein
MMAEAALAATTSGVDTSLATLPLAVQGTAVITLTPGIATVDGSVGIGIANPATTLEVNGSTQHDGYVHNTGYSTDSWYPYTDGNTYIRIPAGGFLHVDALPSYANALTVQGNGNVGIGVTSPIVSLDVSSVAHFGGSTSPVFTSQGAYISWNGLTGGTGETDFINNPGLGAGGFDFVLSNSAGNTVTSAVFIDGSGNVGIGTTVPGVALDVTGGIRSGSSANVTTCSGTGAANGEGTQRYNYTTHAMEYCNGSAWTSMNKTVSFYVPPEGGNWGVKNQFTNAYSCPANTADQTIETIWYGDHPGFTALHSCQ